MGALSVDERMKAFENEEKEEKEEAARKKEEKKDIKKVNQGMKAFDHKADRQEQEEEQGDSTGEVDTEQDENDAPKDNVALSVDERMKAFENEEKEEKEEAVRKKDIKKEKEHTDYESGTADFEQADTVVAEDDSEHMYEGDNSGNAVDTAKHYTQKEAQMRSGLSSEEEKEYF